MKNELGTSNVRRSILGWSPNRPGNVTMYKGKKRSIPQIVLN